MKKNMLILIAGLLSCLGTIAQMKTSVTLEYYKKCMEYCKSLTNSAEREICMRGCANLGNAVTTVNIRTLERAASFVTSLSNRKWREGENEFSSDSKKGLRYFAVVDGGRIVDYVVRNKAGTLIPSKVVSIGKETKRCFIWVNGELVEVRCPDVIIIVHEKVRQ
ncbi:hypothetical protein IQ13_4208 [Lacibacter cauensis]|uniref:Uncharacterized protein n=1 Tax=Lacibacter cauensis TaxID=510947 RepID=A0A562SBD3_9BACT|nr:hypothetical protein [Lacibacter cauensis]TWI77966.1 hypothetical protein IQ13_4208 [Lacibacter cauensis]